MELWNPYLPLERARAEPGNGMPHPDPRRCYFRCPPHSATLSIHQCRANRRRIPPPDALEMPCDLPSWLVQPLACWSCTLAPRVEAGRVPFYTALEVYSGHARREDTAHWAQARPGGTRADDPPAAH